MPTGIYERTSALERFWAKVQKKENGCWEWTGCLNSSGYGQFKINGHLVLVHRFSYELAGGVIPEGLELDHLCRNRRCVNPCHLETVTQSENKKRGIAGITRGNQQRAKIHCPQGHPYDLFNTYYDKTGDRQCKMCTYQHHRIARENKKRLVPRPEGI